jgi:hypothetical protein
VLLSVEYSTELFEECGAVCNLLLSVCAFFVGWLARCRFDEALFAPRLNAALGPVIRTLTESGDRLIDFAFSLESLQ